jgi:hypothetical protein
MPSIALPKSPVRLTRSDEVPRILTRKPNLRPAEFFIASAKRLLQHNRHIATLCRNAAPRSLSERSGHRSNRVGKILPARCGPGREVGLVGARNAACVDGAPGWPVVVRWRTVTHRLDRASPTKGGEAARRAVPLQEEYQRDCEPRPALRAGDARPIALRPGKGYATCACALPREADRQMGTGR